MNTNRYNSPRRALLTAMVAMLSPLATHPAHAATDKQAGANIFEEQCAECHSVQPGRNKKGPSLFGVLGRTAGGQPDYSYSDAMKTSGLSWTQDKLDAYLVYPRKMVPGTKMKYDGLSDARARASLIDFLGNLN